jgi:hypothetical protein
MSDARKRRTKKTGEVPTDAEVEALADEAEGGYAADRLRPRRGRPLVGSAPGVVVPVRLDPDLRRAVQDRADADHTSVSEVVREALRHHLEAG